MNSICWSNNSNIFHQHSKSKTVKVRFHCLFCHLVSSIHYYARGCLVNQTPNNTIHADSAITLMALKYIHIEKFKKLGVNNEITIDRPGEWTSSDCASIKTAVEDRVLLVTVYTVEPLKFNIGLIWYVIRKGLTGSF